MSHNTDKRSHQLAIRCAKLRQQGCTLSEIAELTELGKEKVYARIQLGERLISLEVE